MGTQMNGDLAFLPATELASAIRNREVSPVEATAAALERIERLNPHYNAYLTVCHDEATAAAREAAAAVAQGGELGPLHGVPVSVKDLIYTKGVRSTGGSLIFEDFVPEVDAPLVRRLREAGAIILGKTNTPEFGISATTENKLGPPCRNPWDPARTSGGSSGGAGVAAATGMGYLHVGSDGGGSIRIPSSLCGVFGIKPTVGRIPQYTREWGGYGSWPTLSQAGPMARTVEDAALLLDVLAGPEAGDPFALPAAGSFAPRKAGKLGLRVAWTADMGWAAIDPEVRGLCEAAARRFADLGCEVEEATPAIEETTLGATFLTLAGPGDTAAWGGLLEQRDKLAPYTIAMMEGSQRINAANYVKAEKQRMAMWRECDAFLGKYDLLLMPTLATTAFPIGQPPSEIDGRAVNPFSWTPFTMLCNLTGQPAASLPCGWTSGGLPVGLHLIARAFRERTILEAALAYQQAFPWQDRRSPEPAAAAK
jgi:aspartyl-tRNA(Asn)/glutamyl-tRNA(Gln) amidotransferase subunit A